MSAYSWWIEISRIFHSNLGNSYSIYRFGQYDLRDNINYWLFILELKECYTTVWRIAKVNTHMHWQWLQSEVSIP